MGWSCTVTCRSAKVQERMLAFLGEYFVPTCEVLGTRHYPHHPSRHTKYAETKTSIGFNNPNDHEMAVLRWMAHRVGKRMAFQKKLGPGVSAPWVSLDGREACPVIRRVQWDGRERTEQYIVDDIGWRPVHRWWDHGGSVGVVASHLLGLKREADRKDRLIRADIDRLDQLWEAYDGS